MRLTFLKAAGFRGINRPVSVSFASGFTVISGPNGTGKSSICDAIEFALTGSITKYAATSEKGEDVQDYIWWRGPSPSSDKYVSLGLADDDGAEFVLTRKPDSPPLVDATSVYSRLCRRTDVDAANGIAELCRSSIIRDEWITRLSVDLPETERFNFVRSAVGTPTFTPIEHTLDRMAASVKERTTRAQRAYESARQHVTDLVTEVSRARAEAARAEDVSRAESVIRELLQTPPTATGDLLGGARKLTAGLKLQIENLSRLLESANVLQRREVEYGGNVVEEQQRKLELELQTISTERERIAGELANTQELLSRQQGFEAGSSWAQLYEYGSKLGLQKGKCPLCGSDVSEGGFRNHLSQIRSKLEVEGKQIADVVQRQTILLDRERQTSARLFNVRRQLQELQVGFESLQRERAQLQRELSELSIEVPWSGIGDALESFLEDRRKDLRTLEAAVLVLEASRAHARVVEIERELSVAQAEVLAAEKKLAQLRMADERIRSAAATLKRMTGEIVDNKLAAIKPLLGELYFRLRPHVDWPEISYLIRGDVRRFLSLRVGSGEGLNLRFMFSSGQRRAAGLAFLIAVSLSRPWCLLRSLVFDDPIQHVDDFRALHLVETLSALRQAGQQVICTAQDPALADLMARRLRSSPTAEGNVIEMGYTPGDGVHIARIREIQPFALQVLKTA